MNNATSCHVALLFYAFTTFVLMNEKIILLQGDITQT